MLPEDYAVVKDMVAPCGIRCGECIMGTGTVAETAMNLTRHLKMYDVASWAHELPEGCDVDFERLDHDLAWVQKWLRCPGCLNGGGSSNCPIRICSKEKGLSSCGKCSDLEGCDKFDWLGEKGKDLKAELAGSRAH